MKSTGIVAEYNPFHNGHQYQIEQVRKQLQPDVVIAVMSGNFLQRGEPAIVDKWTRTQMALASGVDLVVELPAIFALQPADFFARGAIQTLGALNIDSLCFGVEEGTASDFMSGAQWMVENEGVIADAINSSTDMHLPYAKQIEQIIDTLAPDFPLYLNSPNNQLGFTYAKEIVRNGLVDQVELLPLARKSAHYHDQDISGGSEIASATAIRLALAENRTIKNVIPEAAYPYLAEAKNQMVTWEDYFPLLQYQLLVQSEESLRGIYQMTEGLENRLKAAAQDARNFKEFMDKIKTKRYTRTRLQRLLSYVLLQWNNEDVLAAMNDIQAIRVLGFSKAGQSYLNAIKHSIMVPLIVNVNKETKELVPFDVSAGEIYRLGKMNLISRQDFGQSPVKLIDRMPTE